MEVFREAKKKPWGLDVSYCKRYEKQDIFRFSYYFFSAESGLRLILSDVVKESPAWRHGLRPGDTIVAVNGWMITLMDKPEVNSPLEE
jgi:C-terminal processing protease CtpA/Prc